MNSVNFQKYINESDRNTMDPAKNKNNLWDMKNEIHKHKFYFKMKH